jgi:2-polyprenyl-3-methyl-5-hydroxy-6-metoxy-1,4-benzoquinol methylase|tara:strand:- start:532 stop:1218 length:687 start_codon:yes stop_codon:yes gene_type:complete
MKKIHYNGFELEHFDSASNFRKYQVSLILKYINGNFVEVGAGKGGLVPYYKKIPKSVTLLEPEKKLFKILKKKFYSRKIRIKNHTVNKLKSYYDTIIYYDVLEHIKKDLSEVRTASKKLKKNGYLIFNVPAYQSFFSEFDRSVGHYKRYNKKDFINIEKKTNLKIEKLVYYDSIGFLFLVLNKIFSLKQKNLKNKIFLWNLLIPVSKLIDFLTFNMFGKSLLCVFRKC